MHHNQLIKTGLILLLCWSCGQSNQSESTESVEKYPTIGSVERLDPAINDIVSQDAKVEILAEGFLWSEGPVWVEELNSLLYSDVPANTVYKWNESDGNQVYLKPSGHTGIEPSSTTGGANGLALDLNGDLLLCQHGDRRLARIKKEQLSIENPEFISVINRFEDKRFNSPNDLAVASNGDIYFTDPPYGLQKQDDDSLKELTYNGVYKLAIDGTLTLLTDDLTRPNGIALSPDEQTLYVANSDSERAIWMAYDLSESGVENGRVFFDATDKVATLEGLPDGLKVNKDGIIFATGPGGVYVFDPSGKHLGTILTELASANCALSDDEKTLYMTTHKYLTRIKL
ncbi:SMP-30/gluconolactonase/LRE family protein [Ekhidna sp.]